MQIKTIQPAEAACWENFVESCPQTVAWHSYHWSEAVARNYDIEFHPIAATENGVIRGILPLYRLRGAKAPSDLISVPFAVAGGLAVDNVEAAETLLDAAVELRQQLGANSVIFKQYRYPTPGKLKTDAHYFNRELNLSTPAPQLWNQLSARNRRAIETAEKGQLVLEYPSDRVSDFYDLLVEFLTHSGMPCPSRRWIQTLPELKMYRIALLWRDGKLAAATMVKAFKTTVSFPYTCVRNPGRSLDAAYALYWRLITKFAADGCQIFHSGRMPESEDVEAYRLGWGGDKHQYYYQYYPDAGGPTEYANKRGWKRELFKLAWRRLPKGLARTVGPRIVARFP